MPRAELEPTGPAVGVSRRGVFVLGYDRLQPGESLLAYTDGVTEARAVDGELFGEDRLRALMQWGIDEDLDPDRQRGCMALLAAFERGGKDPKVRQFSQAYLARLEQVIVHLIAVGQHNGELSTDRSPVLVARTFLSNYYGLRTLGRTVTDRAFLEDVLEGALGIGNSCRRW